MVNFRFAMIPDEPVNRIPSVVSKSDSSSSGSSSESSSDTEDSEEERRNKQLKMLEKEVSLEIKFLCATLVNLLFSINRGIIKEKRLTNMCMISSVLISLIH